MANIKIATSNTTYLIDKWWLDNHKSENRDYGKTRASELGHECERYIWYKLKGYQDEPDEGRIVRLFDRGHREEDVFIKGLKGIGCNVHSEQHKVQYKNVFTGHIDCIIENLPEAPVTPHLGEFKTANEKGFKKVLKEGAPHRHVVQANIYMGLLDLSRCLYLVVNKNTDELHQERIKFNKDLFNGVLNKAERVVSFNEPPSRLSDNSSFFKCKMCGLRKVCHEL